MDDEKALQLGRKLLPAMKVLGEAAEEAKTGILMTAGEDGSMMVTFFGTTHVITKAAGSEKYRMECNGEDWYCHRISEDLREETNA